MSFLDGIKNQLRSVIEWKSPSTDALIELWSNDSNELKNASKLIIGPGQGCIFVYQGKVISILDSELMVNLKTDNIPFWTTITKFMQSFESEHKVGLYFYRKTRILDQKWGTRSPIKYIDPKYKFPVGLQAFGNFSFKISDIELFFHTILGAGYNYSVSNFRDMVNSRITQPFTDHLAEMKYSYSDIDANRNEIAKTISSKLGKEFNLLGFTLTDFRIEGTAFDPKTEKRINRISDLIAESHAAEAVGLNYAQVQQLDAMKSAAANEGGGAGTGMGLGAGISFGKMMGDTIESSDKSNSSDITDSLTKLKKLKDAELISDEEYSSKKAELLSKM